MGQFSDIDQSLQIRLAALFHQKCGCLGDVCNIVGLMDAGKPLSLFGHIQAGGFLVILCIALFHICLPKRDPQSEYAV